MNFKEKCAGIFSERAFVIEESGGVCVISARAFQRYAEF